MARRRVGAPFPRGEARFKIEALLETVKLRLQLAQISKAFADTVPKIRAPIGASDNQARVDSEMRHIAARRFEILTWSLLRSCRRDSDLSVNLCRTAEALRLGLATEIIVLQSHFAFVRFSHEARVTMLLSSNPKIREETADIILTEREIALTRAINALDQSATPDNRQISEWAN